ncbi:hypothetical protein MCOR17_007149 [Pyricularia oryzae]|nr:hypothetical protein MCOR17_007149 [Pyricularia oryzae]
MSRKMSSALLAAFQGLRIAPATTLRPSIIPTSLRTLPALPTIRNARPFSSTVPQLSWLEPQLDRRKKKMKGRCRVPTGGSMKGTTVVWGDYGLRMKDHDRRVSAKHLKMAENVIKLRLRGQKYRLYKRVNCDIGVFTSGNEHRMGKGKGSFDHWASRISVSHVIFELRGVLHEQVIRDALRLAATKIPGQCEIIKKGDPGCVGITKMENGLTLEDLKRPWMKARQERLGTLDVTPQSSAVTNAPNSTSPAQ